ncbi:pantothenate transporter liz1 [Cadophora sp. MPI-SDFR-AT-0126]|nr:pantothenate transporter liz1 [Leotiomycetes sp. MPI-SDFR-AT-0126]
MAEPEQPTKVTFRSWIWDIDTDQKSAAERKLLRKLDWSILLIGCLGFFMKFLDQTNLINAYISGMKEDLYMDGNEYTYATSLYTIAYAIMQVPSTLIVQRVRPALWLMFMEVGWGIWTLAQAGMENTNQLYAFRFLVGLFESSFSPVMTYLIGSWYTKTEMAKRMALFMMTAPFGTAFSGYLQAAVYNNLDGVHGIEGWRWLYIVTGCMTLPVGIATYFFLPDVPDTTTAWFLTEEERALAVARVRKVGTAPPKPVTFRTFLKIMTRWRWYAFVLSYVLYGCCSLNGSFFGIWLKSEGYSVTQRNVIPSATWLISGVATVLWGFFSDFTGSRFAFVLIPLLIGLLPNGILAFWPDGIAIKMFAFLAVGIQLMPGVFFAWAMEVCRDDNEERAVVASSMNAMVYAIVAWLPIVVFPQTMAPDFRIGYPTSWAFNIAAVIGVVAIHFLVQWERKNAEAAATVSVSIDEDLNSEGVEKDDEKSGEKNAVTSVKTVEG